MVPVGSANSFVRSFYLLPPWSDLMERWSGATAHRLELSGEHGGQFTAVLYRRRGRVIHPRLMPYLGCEFAPTPTAHAHKVTLQWLDVAGQFAAQLRALRLRRWLPLPPEVTDVRPFSWRATLASPRYTYCLERSVLGDRGSWSRRIKRSLKAARERGYTVEKNGDLDAAEYNLRSTELRQGFDYSVSRGMLEQAMDALGPEAFRLYNAYDQNGRPASSIIVLYRPGAFVQDWLAGSAVEHLKSGATQLAREAQFDDIRRLEIPGFDFCGANMPAIAAAKSEFGGTLTPFYQVKPLRSPRLVPARIARAVQRTLMPR